MAVAVVVVVAVAGVAEVVAAVLSSMRTVPASLALNGPAVLKKRAAKRIHMA